VEWFYRTVKRRHRAVKSSRRAVGRLGRVAGPLRRAVKVRAGPENGPGGKKMRVGKDFLKQCRAIPVLKYGDQYDYA
jgi:hypothetical protein